MELDYISHFVELKQVSVVLSCKINMFQSVVKQILIHYRNYIPLLLVGHDIGCSQFDAFHCHLVKH